MPFWCTKTGCTAALKGSDCHWPLATCLQAVYVKKGNLFFKSSKSACVQHVAGEFAISTKRGYLLLLARACRVAVTGMAAATVQGHEAPPHARVLQLVGSARHTLNFILPLACR